MMGGREMIVLCRFVNSGVKMESVRHLTNVIVILASLGSLVLRHPFVPRVAIVMDTVLPLGFVSVWLVGLDLIV